MTAPLNVRLPTPGEKYDAQNERELRRQIELAFQRVSTTTTTTTGSPGSGTYAVEAYLYNAGDILVAGHSDWIFVPWDFTITLAEIVTDYSGTLDVSVYSSTYTDWDTFTLVSAAAPVSVSGLQRAHPPLTGWTTTFTGGTYLRFNIINTPTLITKATVTLYLTVPDAVIVSTGGELLSGSAGGVLSGTYPNPSFAEDMATLDELDESYLDAIDRTNHTGTQTASTISDFRDEVEAELVAGTGVTITPAGSGATRTLTLSSAAGLTVKDEGSTLSAAVTSIDFVGATVAATGATAVTVTIGSRLTPTIVQRANIRNDTTIALASTPTVGNTMLWVFAGFTGSESTYAPTGFTKQLDYNSDGNNRVSVWKRTVVGGDTGSYALSTSDNQGCALYEISNFGGVLGVQGGAMSAFFSGTSFTIPVPDSPYEGVNLRILVFEQDLGGYYTITGPPSGVTVDYNAVGGGNHAGAIMVLTDAFSGSVAGSVGSGPTQSVYGLWVVLGRKV